MSGWRASRAPGSAAASAEHNTRLVLAELERHEGWVRPGVVARALGAPRESVSRLLMAAAARGLVEHNGCLHSGSRFRAKTRRAALLPPRVPQGGKVGGTLEGRVLLAVRYRRSTVSELACWLREPVLEVLAAVVRLEREGELERAGRRGGEVVLRLARTLEAAERAETVRVMEAA